MSEATKVKPLPKPEKKHCAPTGCQAGHHTYIVTNWKIGGAQQKAQHMRCQHCLMPMDLQEIEGAEWRTANVPNE